MTEPLAFLNGSLVPQSQAHLALNDAGFVFGATITDLCRTFRHRLYRWPDHLARFRRGCLWALIDVPMSDDEITHYAGQLVAHNASLIRADHDLALVLFATPGRIGYYLGERTVENEPPTLGMHTFPLPFARYRLLIEDGVTLISVGPQVPAACLDPRFKHRSRMHWWRANQPNRHTPAVQTLMLDMDGHVTETGSANFLLVQDGALVSPPRESILDGISLKVVTELCAPLGIPLSYRPISLADCYAADGALLTCTSYCLAGVSQLNDHVFQGTGPMLRRLLEAWNAEVGLDIHGQIMGTANEPEA